MKAKSIRRKPHWFSYWAGAFCFLLMGASSDATEVSGFLKVNPVVFRNSYDSSTNVDFIGINRVKVEHSLSKKWDLEAAYEFTPILSFTNSPTVRQSYLSSFRPYRVSEFNPTFAYTTNAYFNHNFDRLYGTWTGKASRLNIGRQSIAFGSARTVNPTDVFSPFGYAVIDTEVRVGVDAIRYRHEIGEMGELDFWVLLGRHARIQDSAFYGRIRVVDGDLEVVPMLAYFLEAPMIGLDVSTTFEGATLWFEGAWVNPKEQQDYLRFVVGAERLLSTDLTLYSEYHFNGVGLLDSHLYPTLATEFSHQKAGVFLFGRHYFDIGGSYSVHPLHQLITAFKQNLTDGSLLWVFAWEWNPVPNLYANLGTYFGIGRKGLAVAPDSEFGGFPQVFFSRFRFYF